MSLKSSAKTFARNVGIAAGASAVLAGTAFSAVPASAATTSTATTSATQCFAPAGPDQVTHVAAVTHTEKKTTNQSTSEAQSRWVFTPHSTVYPQLYKYVKHYLATEYSAIIPGNKEVDKNQVEYKKSVTETRLTRPGAPVTLYSFTANAQKYERTVPGKQATTHEEYTYSKTQRTYQSTEGSWTVEHKDVYGEQFVAGGSTTYNGVTLAGHWVLASGWYQVPDAFVAAAGINPLTVAKTGEVMRGTYGLLQNAQYEITSIEVYGTDPGQQFEQHQTTTVYWNGSAWVTGSGNAAYVDTAPAGGAAFGNPKTVLYDNGAWTTDTPGAPWVKTGERTVSNNDGTPATTEYATNEAGAASSNPADAALLLTPPAGSGWVADGAPVKVYEAQDGSITTDKASEGWFESATPPAGFTVDGTDTEQSKNGDVYAHENSDDTVSETTDLSQASYFDENDLTALEADKWSPFGDTITTTSYLTSNGDGTYSWTTDASKATPIDEDTTSVTVTGEGSVTLSSLAKVTDSNGNVVVTKRVITPATPDQRIYLTVDSSSNYGTTTDESKASKFNVNDTPPLTFGGYTWTAYGTQTTESVYASIVNGVEQDVSDVNAPGTWIPEGDPVFDPTDWEFVTDSSGNPVTTVDKSHPEIVNGAPEYFDPKTLDTTTHTDTPSAKLTDENWTDDSIDPNKVAPLADGLKWTLVDKRDDSIALPPLVSLITVTDKGAYDKVTKATPVQIACPVVQTTEATSLAHTGTNIDEAAWLAGALLLAGGSIVAYRMASNGRRRAASRSEQ